MHPLDAISIITYLILIFIIAYYTGRKTKVVNSESQYLSNRDLTLTESICSIISTEVSALTFLSIPAFAFNKNFSFAQIYLGAIIGRFFVATVFLPRVYAKGLTIYEIMGKNEKNNHGRQLVALFYSISKILAVGVRLFTGTILVAEFFHINVYLTLFAIIFITFVYTLIGGLKAVVRTDIFQMILFITGGIVAHMMIPKIANDNWFTMMNMAHSAGKTTLFNEPLSILIGIMGGFLFDLSTHGVDQDFAQRIIATKNLKTGQMAIFISGFLSLSVGLLFLGVGALLWSFYQTHPFPPEVPNADRLFAHFIVNYFPVGIKGLVVAGALASTMSTLDSAINAVSACIYNDIFPNRTKRSIPIYFLIDNLVITIILFIVATLASKNDSLLLLGLKIQSWTAGTLLCLFVCKLIFHKWIPYQMNYFSIAGAYIFGTLGVFINVNILQWDWNLNVYFGFIFTFLFLKIYSIRDSIFLAKP